MVWRSEISNFWPVIDVVKLIQGQHDANNNTARDAGNRPSTHYGPPLLTWLPINCIHIHHVMRTLKWTSYCSHRNFIWMRPYVATGLPMSRNLIHIFRSGTFHRNFVAIPLVLLQKKKTSWCILHRRVSYMCILYAVAGGWPQVHVLSQQMDLVSYPKGCSLSRHNPPTFHDL